MDKKKKNIEDIEEEDRKRWIKHLDGVNQSEKVARLKAERQELMQNLILNKDELENEQKLSALGNNVNESDFTANP